MASVIGAFGRAVGAGGTRRLAAACCLAAIVWAGAPAMAQDVPVAPAQPSDPKPAMAPPAPPILYGPVVPGEEGVAATPLARPPAISPELAAAADVAVDTYPSIAAAKAQIRAARSDIRGAKWLQFPSVSVEVLGFTGGRRAITGDRDITSNLVVDQPIWAGGRISGGIRKAEAEKLVADARLLETVQDIELRVIDAYFAIAGAAREAAILSDSLDEHNRLVESIARRVQQEVSPSADLDLARSRTAQLEQELATAEARRQAALTQFRALVSDPGFNLGNVPAYDPIAHHPDPAQAAEQALTCSPTRQRRLAEAQVAKADIDVARGQLMPQLSAEYSRNEITGDRVGLVLRAQTSGGFSGVSALDSARLRRDSADLEVGAAERALRDAIGVDLVENASTRGRIASAGTAARNARIVTESYKRQFNAGRRTWLDVMNAVREASSLELAEAAAEVSAMQTAARILLRTCRWQPDGSGGQ